MATVESENVETLQQDIIEDSDDEVGWECGSEHYELSEKVGRGAFAEVFAAKCSSGKRIGTGVAIKVIDLDGISSNLEDIRQEVATLRLCNHPNVLRFYASFVEHRREKHELWLITQLLSKGSCLHVMTEAKKTLNMPSGMHEDWLVWILRESLNGLRYFHEHQQIHRDIKAGNILLDSVGRVALADFGVSRWINGALNNGSNDGRAKTFVGTPCWMAPEVMEQMDGYDFKADIWSLGITALELAKGHAPYSSFAPMKVLLYTIQNEPPSLASYPDGKRDSIPFSRSFRDLVRMCLQKDPSKRPTCAKLLTHALFTQKEPNPNSLVNDLLSKMRDFGDVSTVPLASQLTKQTSPVDAANAHTARAGSDGSGGGVVQGAAGLEAVMNQALQEEEAQPYYPKWSFGDAEIREALSQIGVNLAPPMPPSHPQTVLEETAESNQIEQEVEHTNENVSDQQNSSQNDNLDIVNNNTMEVDQEVDHGGHGGEESNQSIESEDEQFQHHAGVRADQDAYVSAMGGALELLSEEEVNEDKTAEAAIASDQNDVVFAFINAIGNEFGGEFKSAESLDDSPHSVPSEIPNNGDGADNGDGIQPGRTEDEERRNEGEGGDEEAMR